MGIFRGKKGLRVIEYMLTFLAMISLNFALPRMMPGDPFLHSGGASEVVSVYSGDQLQYFREYYGLEKPLHEQFTTYLYELARGDLGFSYYYKENVSGIIVFVKRKGTLLTIENVPTWAVSSEL